MVPCVEIPCISRDSDTSYEAAILAGETRIGAYDRKLLILKPGECIAPDYTGLKLKAEPCSE